MSKRYGPIGYYHLYKNDDIFYLISYGLTEYKDEYSWNELYFFKDKYPTINVDLIKSAVIDDINKETDNKILTEFKWNGLPVYLSSENQFNFKAAYDLAVQTQGQSLPVKFKLGEKEVEVEDPDSDEEFPHHKIEKQPVYYTFEDMETFTDFYTKTITFINQCLNEGWQKKDSIDWSEYEEALKPKTTEE